MKKIFRGFKRGALIAVAAIMVAAMGLSGMAFAAPVNSVVVDNSKTLNAATPYFCGGVAAPVGTLDGITCTAKFDPGTGTLTLWNYVGSDVMTPFLVVGDLTVDLIETNVISPIGNGLWTGESGSNLTITSTANGSLAINQPAAPPACVVTGIFGQGDVTITGNAAIGIDVIASDPTPGCVARGIQVDNDLNILDSAQLMIRAEATASTYAYGIVSLHGDVNVNTTGSITITTIAGGTSISAHVDGDFNLDKARKMILQFGATGTGVNAGGLFKWEPSQFEFDDSLPGYEGYNHKMVFGGMHIIPASVVGTPITPVDVSVGLFAATMPVTFSAVGLPAGLSINSTTGVISGTPTTVSTGGSAVITVTDAISRSADLTIAYEEITAAGTTEGGEEEGDVGSPSAGYFAETHRTDAVIDSSALAVLLALIAGCAFLTVKKFAKR